MSLTGDKERFRHAFYVRWMLAGSYTETSLLGLTGDLALVNEESELEILFKKHRLVSSH